MCPEVGQPTTAGPRLAAAAPMADRRAAEDETRRAKTAGLSPQTRRLWKVAGIAVLVIFGMYLLGEATQVVLVIFAGLILAAYLSGIASWLSRHTPLGPKLSIAAVLVSHATATGLFMWWAVDSLVPEVRRLSEELPRAAQTLLERVRATDWGATLLDAVPSMGRLQAGGEWVASITGVLSSFAGIVVNAAVLLFVGIYVAADPGGYRGGFIRLVPPARRDRIEKLLDECTSTLRLWVLGRMVGATVIGIGVWIGLSLLDVPLALLLGLLAGALTFVPNIGPIASAVPPILLALVDDPMKAVWVLVLYVSLQLVESYLLTPFIEKRAVKVPPALLLAAQIVMGVLTGLIGLALAPPLVALAIVITRRLYVEDVLGDIEPADAPAKPRVRAPRRSLRELVSQRSQ